MLGWYCYPLRICNFWNSAPLLWSPKAHSRREPKSKGINQIQPSLKGCLDFKRYAACINSKSDDVLQPNLRAAQEGAIQTAKPEVSTLDQSVNVAIHWKDQISRTPAHLYCMQLIHSDSASSKCWCYLNCLGNHNLDFFETSGGQLLCIFDSCLICWPFWIVEPSPTLHLCLFVWNWSNVCLHFRLGAHGDTA